MITPNVSLVSAACQAAVPGTAECAAFDGVETALAAAPQMDMPITHRFTPGLYIREIFMPASVFPAVTIATSRIHLTEHPFVVSKGKLQVWDEKAGWVLIQAPYTGITKPGTRRILHIIEDTVWSTFHVTTETDPDKILDQITLDHFDHLDGLKDFKKNTDATQNYPQEGIVIPSTVDKTNRNRLAGIQENQTCLAE